MIDPEIENIVKFKEHRDDIHEQTASLDALLITSGHKAADNTPGNYGVSSHSAESINVACQNEKCCWLVDKIRSKNLRQRYLSAQVHLPIIESTWPNIV